MGGAPVPNCAYPPLCLGSERNTGLLVSRTVGSSLIGFELCEHNLNDRPCALVPSGPGRFAYVYSPRRSRRVKDNPYPRVSRRSRRLDFFLGAGPAWTGSREARA